MKKFDFYNLAKIKNLQKEFFSISKNKLPHQPIEVVYVFSGEEKKRLIGSSLDRLKTGVEIWERLSKKQDLPPIFLFQGSSEWYTPVNQAFDSGLFRIPDSFLRLELIKTWRNTLDQFLQIPIDLIELKQWLIITSPWHLPRTKRYSQKWWPRRQTSYWTSPYRKTEFKRYMPTEIKKIIEYAKTGDLLFDLHGVK